ncbi:MAG: tetratricopeptide repeat protein [Novosphingobium sp.]
MRFLIFLSLLAIAACSPTPQQNLAKAQREFAAHDFGAARLDIANALADQPGDKAMLLLQAKVLISLGDGDGAGAALAKLTGAAPPSGELAELCAEAALLRHLPDLAQATLGESRSIEAERLRALVAIAKRDGRGSAEHFKKGLAAGGSVRLFADYSRFQWLIGDLAGAQDMANRAAKASPDDLDSLLLGGKFASLHGDLAKALENYRKAAKLYPASLAALTGEAAVLGDLGRMDEMQQMLDRVAAFAPGDATVIFLGAKAAATRKDWAGVQTIVQGVEATLQPTDPLRQIYGEALLRLGQNNMAIAQLSPIANAQPGNRGAARLLGEALLAAGDAKGAMATLRPLANQRNASSEELALMAKAAQAASDPSTARYSARSKQAPIQALAREFALGDAAIRGGNWAAAAGAYRRILAVSDGRNVIVLNNMAYAQLMLGNTGQALDFADRALKLEPHNASVLDTAGWAQFRSGRNIAEARRLLQLAADRAPTNVTIRTHLAETIKASG